MSHSHQQVLDDNAEALKLFVTKYLFDMGVQVQLIEAITKELYGHAVTAGATVDTELATNPRRLLSTALEDVAEIGVLGGMTHNLFRVIQGAVSFEFLVRYARKLDPAVMPHDILPSDEVVAALLEMFHEANRQSVAG